MKTYNFIFYPFTLIFCVFIPVVLITYQWLKLPKEYCDAIAFALMIAYYDLVTAKRPLFPGKALWLKTGIFMLCGILFSFPLLMLSGSLGIKITIYPLFQIYILKSVLTAWAGELIFREYLINKLQQVKCNQWLTIIISALYFTLVFGAIDGTYWFTGLFLGLAMAWLYLRTRDLTLNIALHYSYCLFTGIRSEFIDHAPPEAHEYTYLLLLGLSILLFITLFFLTIKINDKLKKIIDGYQ